MLGIRVGMYPKSGEVGSFKLMMYRGTKPEKERLKTEFASDPGDYGAGEYWTDDKSFAEGYGEVLEQLIELENVYHIPKQELKELIEEYRTCKMEDGHETRLKNSKRLTEMFKSKGYKAVLTEGYETFTAKGLCIF